MYDTMYQIYHTRSMNGFAHFAHCSLKTTGPPALSHRQMVWYTVLYYTYSRKYPYLIIAMKTV